MANRKETIDDLINASQQIGHYYRDEPPSMQSRDWEEHGIEMPPIQITIPQGHYTYATTSTPKNIKRGKWTAEEDDVIIREVNNNGNNFAARSSDQLEGRDAASVFDRWHKLLKYNPDNFGLLPKDYTSEQRKQHIKIYGKTLKYTPEEREQAIERWKMKRERRNVVPLIKYEQRKADANARKRDKGRFIGKGGKTKRKSKRRSKRRKTLIKKKKKMKKVLLGFLE